MHVTLDLDGQETVAYAAVLRDLERIAVRADEASEEVLDEQLAERCRRAIADLRWILDDAYGLSSAHDAPAIGVAGTPVAVRRAG